MSGDIRAESIDTVNQAPISQGMEHLRERALPGGGFAMYPGGEFRADATAWAVMTLAAMGAGDGLIGPARQRLAAVQLQDGRVSISPEHPEAYWPTPLAVLAWQGSPVHREAQGRAAAFLLATTGREWGRERPAIVGHDPDLEGWSWRSDTSAWAEPTALAMMALEAAGYGDHPRLAEARRLLLDRQLPDGGWNYGNTMVFGQVLNPMPESTGMVLNALSHQVPRDALAKSIAYLEGRLAGLLTPWSLGWAMLGLGAWGARPAEAPAAIQACVARQERFPVYDTSSLALILLASRAAGGLVSLYRG
jgi:hypothetical protein